MGRSPAPVARGPGRLLSARDPQGANKAAESPPSPGRPLPPRAHVTRGWRPRRRRVRTRTVPGTAKAPPGPRSPSSPRWVEGRGGSRRASHPDWRGKGRCPLTRPVPEITSSSLPYSLSQDRGKSPQRSPRTWGRSPPNTHQPPTLGWARGLGVVWCEVGGPLSAKLLFMLYSFILVFKDTAFPFWTQPDVSVYH